MCPSCIHRHEGIEYCKACAKRLGVRGREGGRAMLAFSTAVVSLYFCCLPAGIPAVILGYAELAAIERGASPKSGKKLAQVAILIGWIEIAGTLLAALFFAATALGDP